MHKNWKAAAHVAAIGSFTLFTQTGGVIWLGCLPLFHWINKRFAKKWARRTIKLASFAGIYLLLNVWAVPPLARWQSGRVPLPVWGHPHLKPHAALYYCLLNHHYVRPGLKAGCERVAESMAAKYPGAVVYYLDANFPFFDGYPLQPHFSHRRGLTIDIALHWLDAKTNKPIDGAPFAMAYGANAKPLPGEIDLEEKCRQQGNWYRELEPQLASPFYRAEDFRLDEARTKDLVRLFSEDHNTKKILLEPHLKARLGLGRYDNIRFQGYRAARHDDHIHVVAVE